MYISMIYDGAIMIESLYIYLLGCMREGVENSVVYMVKVRVSYLTTNRNFTKIQSLSNNTG